MRDPGSFLSRVKNIRRRTRHSCYFCFSSAQVLVKRCYAVTKKCEILKEWHNTFSGLHLPPLSSTPSVFSHEQVDGTDLTAVS